MTALGGAGASAVTEAGLPSGCSGGGGLVVNCTPTESGSFAVLVNVTDSLGETATSVAGLDVVSSLTSATVIGKLPSHDVDLGVPVSMSVTAGEGAPPYNYTWDFGDGGIAYGASVSHTYVAAGEFVVSTTVTDQAGGRMVNETVVTVEPDPTVSIAVAPGLTTDVGLMVSLGATVSGGAGGGSGGWQFGDGTTSQATSVEHAWATPGLYTVNYTYTDAVGQVAKATAIIVVHAPLTGTFSVVPLSSSPVVGTKFDFNATLVNGTPGYSVAWSFDDGSIATGTTVTHAYGTPGTYQVKVSVLDAAGAYLNSTFKNFTVGPGPSKAGPLFGGGFGSSFVLGLVVGAVIAAVALFFAERTRRAGPPGPPSPYVPPPAQRRGRP